MSTLFFIVCFLAIWEAFDFSLIPILIIVGVFFIWALSGSSEKTEEQIRAKFEKSIKREEAREKIAKKLHKPMIITIIVVLLINVPFWAKKIIGLRKVKEEAEVYCEEAGLTNYSISFEREKESDFCTDYTIIIKGEMSEDLDYESIIHLLLELDELEVSTWLDNYLFYDLYVNGEEYTFDETWGDLYRDGWHIVYSSDSLRKYKYDCSNYTYESDTKDTSTQNKSTWSELPYTPSGDWYNTDNYSDAEDFYYDNYDDFESYEDAEDYFNDYYD